MATKKKATLETLIFSWGSAAGLAALVFVLLIVLGDWGLIQAVWMAAMVFVGTGLFNYFIFARPTPPLAGSFPPEMASGAGRSAPASTRKGPAEAPAPTDPASSEPPAAAMAAATDDKPTAKSRPSDGPKA